MSSVRPELVFLTGPQAGQRVEIASNVVTVGRYHGVEVRIEEPCASRRQMRLVLTPVGWMMENLSANGTRVNGKRIKSRNKKVILATGDVFSIGVETRILFVSPGDDPDQAVADWQRANPLPAVPPPAAEQEPQSPDRAEAAADVPRRAGQHPAERTGRGSAKAADTHRPQRSKLIKYAVFGGIYAVALAALVVFLASSSGGKRGKPARTGGMLTDKDIAEVLSQVRPGSEPIPTRAAAELRIALGLYANLPSKSGDLYRCVRNFQLYLAHSRHGAFKDVQHELKYQRALAQLIKRITDGYRNAWALEQAGRWADSGSAWEQLKAEIPETDENAPAFKKLVANIDGHLTYVRGRMLRRRRR